MDVKADGERRFNFQVFGATTAHDLSTKNIQRTYYETITEGLTEWKLVGVKVGKGGVIHGYTSRWGEKVMEDLTKWKLEFDGDDRRLFSGACSFSGARQCKESTRKWIRNRELTPSLVGHSLSHSCKYSFLNVFAASLPHSLTFSLPSRDS